MIDSLGRGGAEQHLVDLLPALVRRGVQCEVVALMPPYTLAPALISAGIPVHELGLTHRWHVGQAVIRLLRLISKIRPDVIQAHFYFSGLYVALTRLFASAPARVVLLLNLDYDSYPANTVWRRFRRAADTLAISRGMDARVAISRAVARHYSRQLRPGPIRVIPIATDTRVGHNVVVDRAALRRSYGIDDDESLLLLPGRFVHEKGHRFLVDAVRSLEHRGSRARALMVGDGPLRDAVRAQAQAAGVDHRVTLVRSIPHADLMALFQVADLVVVPSTHEGLGLVVLEALLAGTPVVAAAAGGIPEVIKDGVTGLLVPPGDAHALADAIERLIVDPDARTRLAAAGRARVRGVHDANRLAAEWQDLYRTVGKGSAPTSTR